MLKKIARFIGYLLFLAASTLLLLELSYRYYWIDFYGGNLRTLNTQKQLHSSTDTTLLVLGDSFSADRDSYVRHLRSALPHYQVVNASVPGTCIHQHRLLLKKRLRQFSPRLLIYQIYAGNDLLEFRHPLDSPRISRVRKLYWWLADRFLVLGYINAKLPHLRQAIYHDLPTGKEPKLEWEFSPEHYSARSKMLFRAEPALVENTVLMKGGRGTDLRAYTKSLKEMIERVPKNCKIWILVMPHCIQLGSPYLERLQAIGAQVTEPEALTANPYSFIDYLQKQLPSERVRLLNPLPLLQAQDSLRAVYYPNDPHLNPWGQELVSRYLEEMLAKKNIFE